MRSRLHFVISGLWRGGAERMLLKLISRLDRARFVPTVISLSERGPLADELLAMDVPVHALGMRRGIPSLRGFLRLRRLLSESDLVQTWMYHADLVGGLAAYGARRPPVIWNIRQTDLGLRSNKLRTLATLKACAALSRRVPTQIVCCAEAARQSHVAVGYDATRMRVIPNGFDETLTSSREEARATLRRGLGLKSDALVVGLVARYHPAKDHRTFVLAAARLRSRQPHVRFVLCGERITIDNSELARTIRDAGCGDAFHLLGLQADAPRIAAGFDIATSSSRGEGFSNAIGEAMLAGVPCAVTDAGDSALVVAETGRVVPSGNPDALCAAWEDLVRVGPAERLRLGDRARRRILEKYSLASVTRQYEDLYHEVLAGRSAC